MKNITLSLAAWLLLKSLPLLGQIPANQLPLRIGADQASGNVFRGEMAAVRLYDRALAAAQIKGLAEAQPLAQGKMPGLVGQWLRPSLPVAAGQKFDFSHGATIEAWIRPDAGMGGRIVDKITPGGNDGFLLDTHPGNALRLIVGNDTLTHPLPPSNGWTHVAATVDDSGLLTLYANGVRVASNGTESDGVAVSGAVEGPGKPLTLWCRRPARRWTEACVIGNGRLGGMVWGGVKKERIDLNEDTLWSGEPSDNLNPNGLKSLPEIRRLLVAGRNADAQRLVERDMNGKYNESYQPLGDLTIEFPITGDVPPAAQIPAAR